MTARNSRISISLFLVAVCIGSCGPSQDKDPVVVINNTTGDNSNPNGTPNSTTPNSTPNSTTNNLRCQDGQTFNPVTSECEGPGTNNGTPGINENCPPEARPVYLVEADIQNPSAQGTLVRFDPEDRMFTDLGQLNCPAQLDATPFSMSVDRDATAWVLYSSGELFEVSTTDASCQATTFQPGQEGYDVFGMGFVLNNPDNEDETLVVAGGSGPGSFETPRIGYVTFPDLQLRDLADIDGWPEMSGTAGAELWAFFPDPLSGGARVSQVVPATGDEVQSIPVDSVITGNPNAWAFAHWGGRFYLFYKSVLDDSTNVFEVRKDGAIEEIMPNTGRYIVGAGVSTCAPLVIL